MKSSRAALATLALLAALPAGAVEYAQILPGQGRVGYVTRQMGVPVEGEFKRFTARLNFDPAKPEAAHASLEIDLASIDAGLREVYEEVTGRNWFNVRQYPQARFESSAVRGLGGNRYEVRGSLTVKGKSREVAAPFTYTQSGPNAVFDGGFVLRRLEFGIGEGAWGDPDTVADEVQVRFRLVAAPAAPAAAKPGKAGAGGGKARTVKSPAKPPAKP
jgi:polyisoprenoid-binding protein YceI